MIRILILLIASGIANSFDNPNLDEHALTISEQFIDHILQKTLKPFLNIFKHIVHQIKLLIPNTPKPPLPTSTTTSKPQPSTESPDPNGCYCGSPNIPTQARITGGYTAGKNQFPWIVGLGLWFQGRPTTVFCSGTIVSSRTVVTAAHCVESRKNRLRIFVVLFGEHDLTKPDGKKSIRVCATTVHPNRVKGDYYQDYDYAILTLCEDLTWSKAVQPVCLPTDNSGISNSEFDKSFANKQAIVAGWGTTSTNPSIIEKPGKLQTATVNILSDVECKAKWSYISPRQMCAVGENKGVCKGDGGGPLVVFGVNRFRCYLVGIVSYGGDVCGDEVPGVFARVYNQMPWLIKNMKGTSCQG